MICIEEYELDFVLLVSGHVQLIQDLNSLGYIGTDFSLLVIWA